MDSFGARLKTEREARGISLQDISDNTKIGVRLLRAIEDEQLDRLPGGIFDKSFLRQYARYLGLDEDRIIAEYLQAVGKVQEPLIPFAHALPEEQSRLSIIGYPRLILTAVCLGIAVATVFYAVRQFTERRVPVNPLERAPLAEPAGPMKENPVPPAFPPDTDNPLGGTPASAPSQPPLPAPQPPSETSPVTAAGQERLQGLNDSNRARVPSPPVAAAVVEKTRTEPSADDAAAGGLVLQINAHREVWVAISGDGQKQWQGTLAADRTRRAQARESFELTLGDAGAVELTLNGKPLPPVGRTGEVKKITISPKGVAQPAP